ncbi:MAG: ABC-F family ATP-binding cassette domain-containing protein [Nannocystaceae bacterium]
MTILSARDLRRSYGAKEVLMGVSLSFDTGLRAGLVGRNGSGKSTLARILAGIEAPDAGQVVRSRDVQVAYLEQVPRFEPGRSAVDSVLEGKQAWVEAYQRHEEASEKLARGPQGAELNRLLASQAEAASQVENGGGWDARHEAEALLGKLGVPEFDQSVDELSGGQQRRVALARLFAAAPDLAILDEPTNHLDIASIEWLETYLRESFKGAVLLVTHDRYLLNRVVETTFEMSRGELFRYDGGWEQYLVAKAQRDAHTARVESNRRNYLRRELEWLRRQPKARTGKSKSRVGKVEAVAGQSAPREERVAALEVGETRSGKTVMDLKDLRVARGGKTLVSGLTLTLSKGLRLGIIGANGCGKTSLLACIMGALDPVGGSIVRGKNAKVAYLDQTRGGLDPEAKVYDAVAEGRAYVDLGGNQMAVRAYLERFLFDSAAQQQKIGSLSGGERARVALAKVLREGANVLILDEPTNDLDVDTLAALEAALLEFDGTLLAVTHDRWFLDRIATGILAFENDGQVDIYAGNYADYVALRPPRRGLADSSAGAEAVGTAAGARGSSGRKTTRHAVLTFVERKELDALVPKIERAETDLRALEAELGLPEFYARPHASQREHRDRVGETSRNVERMVARWEELEARLDDA